MSDPNKIHSKKNLPILLIVCVISSCSGGSTLSPENVDSGQNGSNNVPVNQHNLEQHSNEQDASAMSGTIFIEERNGKTVFDAFFSPRRLSVINNDSIDEVISDDACSVSKLQSNTSFSSPIELGVANGEADYATVGAAVTIKSRVGQFETLIKQQLEDITVYAPDSRWQSEPLPDDAVLLFDSVSVLKQLDPVNVPPLLPLVWLSPETGVMSNPGTSLKWEASLDEQIRIKLRLSAIDFRDSLNPVVVNVSCDLVDDGLFTVPAVFQQQLPDDGTGIVVYAVRERIQNVQANNSNLTVVQLSYPAPMTQ